MNNFNEGSVGNCTFRTYWWRFSPSLYLCSRARAHWSALDFWTRVLAVGPRIDERMQIGEAGFALLCNMRGVEIEGVWPEPCFFEPGSLIDGKDPHNLEEGAVLVRSTTLLMRILSATVQRLLERINRFEPGGDYHDWILKGKVKQFIWLDFRISVPGKRRGMYFLSFLYFFQSALILSHCSRVLESRYKVDFPRCIFNFSPFTIYDSNCSRSRSETNCITAMTSRRHLRFRMLCYEMAREFRNMKERGPCSGHVLSLLHHLHSHMLLLSFFSSTIFLNHKDRINCFLTPCISTRKEPGGCGNRVVRSPKTTISQPGCMVGG